MHYNRWHRTGSTNGHDRGAHQKAKTHCPNGRPYDELAPVAVVSKKRWWAVDFARAASALLGGTWPSKRSRGILGG